MAFVYRTKAMANLGVCFIVTLCSCVCARVCVYTGLEDTGMILSLDSDPWSSKMYFI